MTVLPCVETAPTRVILAFHSCYRPTPAADRMGSNGVDVNGHFMSERRSRFSTHLVQINRPPQLRLPYLEEVSPSAPHADILRARIAATDIASARGCNVCGMMKEMVGLRSDLSQFDPALWVVAFLNKDEA